MSSFLVLILCLTVIQCQEICQLIQTSGHFNGFQVYHSYTPDILLMYKNTIEWEFQIIFNRRDKDYSLKTIPNTFYNIDSKTINMFGTTDSRRGYDCNVKYQSQDSQRIVTNWNRNSILNDTYSQYNPKSVIFKALESLDNWVIIYDKNGPNISCYNAKNAPKDRLKKLAECESVIKPLPKFVTHMTKDLLESIDGVVDYKLGQKFGHLLFFNINGRPKYCFQPIDEDLKCNSEDVLKPMFEECFQKGFNHLNWIIPVVVVIGIVVLIVIVVVVVRVMMNRKEESRKRREKRNQDELSAIDSEKKARDDALKEQRAQATQPSTPIWLQRPPPTSPQQPMTSSGAGPSNATTSAGPSGLSAKPPRKAG